jgi:hypothetical protein
MEKQKNLMTWSRGWIVQASTDMSSLRGLVGKGMGSIAVEAGLNGFASCIASHRFPLSLIPTLE